MKAIFSVALTAAMLTMAVPAWGQCVGCASSGPVFGSSSYSTAGSVQYAQATYTGNYVGGYTVQAYQPTSDLSYGTYTSDCGAGCGQVVNSGSIVSAPGSYDCGSCWTNSCGTTVRRSGRLAGRGRLINRSIRGNNCGQAAYTNLSGGCNTGCGSYGSSVGCNTGCGQVSYAGGCGQVAYAGGCGQVMYNNNCGMGCGMGCGQVVYNSGCVDCASSTVVTGGAVAAPEVVSPPEVEESTPAVTTPEVPTPAVPTPDET